MGFRHNPMYLFRNMQGAPTPCERPSQKAPDRTSGLLPHNAEGRDGLRNPTKEVHNKIRATTRAPNIQGRGNGFSAASSARPCRRLPELCSKYVRYPRKNITRIAAKQPRKPAEKNAPRTGRPIRICPRPGRNMFKLMARRRLTVSGRSGSCGGVVKVDIELTTA